jgi:hypothetical protein
MNPGNKLRDELVRRLVWGGQRGSFDRFEFSLDPQFHGHGFCLLSQNPTTFAGQLCSPTRTPALGTLGNRGIVRILEHLDRSFSLAEIDLQRTAHFGRLRERPIYLKCTFLCSDPRSRVRLAGG